MILGQAIFLVPEDLRRVNYIAEPDGQFSYPARVMAGFLEPARQSVIMNQLSALYRRTE